MNWQEYLKSPIYEKLEVANKLSTQFPNTPAFEKFQRLSRLSTQFPNTPTFEKLQRLSRIHPDFIRTLHVLERAHEIGNNYRKLLEHLEDNHLEIKEKRVKPLVKMYRKALENEYGINVQYDLYFYDSFGEMPIDEFLELVENEGLKRHLLEYAEKESQKFHLLAASIVQPDKSFKEAKKEPIIVDNKENDSIAPRSYEGYFISKDHEDEALSVLLKGNLVDKNHCAIFKAKGSSILLGVLEAFLQKDYFISGVPKGRLFIYMANLIKLNVSMPKNDYPIADETKAKVLTML